MKDNSHCSLRNNLELKIKRAIENKRISDSAAFEKFKKSWDKIEAIRQEEDICCMLVFIVYLCFTCDDVPGLISDLKNILLEHFDELKDEQ